MKFNRPNITMLISNPKLNSNIFSFLSELIRSLKHNCLIQLSLTMSFGIVDVECVLLRWLFRPAFNENLIEKVDISNQIDSTR